MKRGVPVVAGVALLVAAGLGARPLLRAALDGACENQPLQSVPAPGGHLHAVVFSRGCGATTGFNTQVSLLATGAALPNEGGNVLSADTDHGRAPGGAGGGPEITVVWEADDRLVVRHHPAARLFHQATRVGEVEVRYERSVSTTDPGAAADKGSDMVAR